MEPNPSFSGFTPQTLAFFARLKRNNDRAWFERHKAEYTQQVLEPARLFVHDMGQALNRLCPGLIADPSPGGSIFRIHRDTRFSSDKTPYKTHLGVYFWLAGGKKMDRPGFYFELDETGLGLYAGWYIFSPEVMQAYRQAVADEERGDELLAITRQVQKKGLTIGGQKYKRVPRGFAVDPARGELLKHGGLYTEQTCGKAKELFSPALVNHCLRQWKQAVPLYEWLCAALAGDRHGQ